MKLSDFSESSNDQKRPSQGFQWSVDINFTKSFGTNDRISFYRDLAMALNAGADISQSILYLDDGSKKRKNELIQELHADLMKGHSLSEAMSNTKQFNTFESVSVEVGENTGRLVDVLNRLSSTLERSRDLKRQLIAVSTYPILLVGLTMGVLIFMLFFVVPTFQDLYQRFDAELPALTRTIISLSQLVNGYTISAVVLAISGLSIYLINNREAILVRKLQYNIFGRIPVFGGLWRENVLSQYFDFFALMLSSGIPINTTLEHLGNLTYAYPLKEETKLLLTNIEIGASLNGAMKKASFFNPGIISIVKIGEESNSLDQVFDNLREQYTKKSEFSLKTFGAAIEPILIVVIAAIVAIILLAMYLPIFEFSSSI